jgi:hypothetical protein
MTDQPSAPSIELLKHWFTTEDSIPAHPSIEAISQALAAYDLKCEELQIQIANNERSENRSIELTHERAALKQRVERLEVEVSALKIALRKADELRLQISAERDGYAAAALNHPDYSQACSKCGAPGAVLHFPGGYLCHGGCQPLPFVTGGGSQTDTRTVLSENTKEEK